MQESADHVFGRAVAPAGGYSPADARRDSRPRWPTTRGPPRDIDRGPALTPEVAFLLRRGIPANILSLAVRLAEIRGTSARDELFANGFDRKRYWSILAEDLGLTFAAELPSARICSGINNLTADAVRFASTALFERGGQMMLAIAPPPGEIDTLRQRLRRNPALSERLIIATPEAIREFLVARRHVALTHYAVNRLARTLPPLSARTITKGKGVDGRMALVAAMLALCQLELPVAVTVAGFLASFYFVNCSAWKLAAACRRLRPLRLEAIAGAKLPSYTVLVPLYREAAIVPDLVRHLTALDYPESKLQILVLLEADDTDSCIAVAREATPPIFEVVLIPPSAPRTKPKALTYALPFARGDMVVVYDAEDRPEPDQLRKAAAAFRENPTLGCVQARLRPDNGGSWLARMFAVEYAANFEILLPALASWGVPVPLGGTSNHFPRAVLDRVSGWDPFNVTEDADLGIRLARFGYRTATIFARTSEEAPITFRQWLPQRRRWMKGWMQTALVCLNWKMPAGLKLSLRESLAVHGIVSAGVLGVLLYPVSLIVITLAVLAVARGSTPEDGWVLAFLALNLANVVAIVVAAVVSSLRGLAKVRALRLAVMLPLLPIYWLLMSLAAWQAVLQLIRTPSVWEKTTHGVARDRRAADPANLLL